MVAYAAGATTPHLPNAFGSGATEIATGEAHTCAIVNGGLRCWGNNASGQLGDSSTTRRDTPTQIIAASSNVTAVTAGKFHTCVVIYGGVQCWGNNAHGQLGDGTATQRNSPVQIIPSGSGVTAIAAGEYHTCAVINGGQACWGGNGNGQLADATFDFNAKYVVKLLGTPLVNAVAVNRYRINIPATRGHLFTTDLTEYRTLTTGAPTVYLAEGVDHKVFKQAVSLDGQTATPYYRLYINSVRQHFWTTDANEYTVLRANTNNFLDDGIDSYIFLNPGVTGTVPLYRLVFTGTAIHHWTTDTFEFNALINNGWLAEGNRGNPAGVTGYVFPK
jgi:alpha-tubulin suppressor-like RCC1 family protein